MYLQNKYTKIYNSIIDRAKSRTLPQDNYVEEHHVVPKSIGGNDSKDNLVKLTAREHRLCHLLLPKMTVSKEHTKKMWYAAWMILRVETASQQRLISKGKFYELAKQEFKKSMSELHTSKTVSDETRQKISESRKGKPSPNKGKVMSAEQKQKLSDAKKGTRQSPEVIARQVASRAGYTHTEETKKKIGNGNRGKTMPARSESQKKAVSEKLKGRVVSEETKQKMAAARKQYWASRKAASE